MDIDNVDDLVHALKEESDSEHQFFQRLTTLLIEHAKARGYEHALLLFTLPPTDARRTADIHSTFDDPHDLARHLILTAANILESLEEKTH